MAMLDAAARIVVRAMARKVKAEAERLHAKALDANDAPKVYYWRAVVEAADALCERLGG